MWKVARAPSAMAVYIIFFLFFLISAASADQESGLVYLHTQQSADGSIYNSSTSGSLFQSTAESLRSLLFIQGEAFAGIEKARQFLDIYPDIRSTEYLSRGIVASVQAGVNAQPLIDELALRQGKNGGFGSFVSHDSSPLDTAYALEALAVANVQTTQIKQGVNYLLGSQSTDGAWMDDAGEPSVFVTALAMQALLGYRNGFSGVSHALEIAQDFLLAQRQSDTGLWSEDFESALALIAIVPNVAELSVIESTLATFNARQLSNGSWNDDAYSTALALRALNTRPSPSISNVVAGAISGTVVNGETLLPVTLAELSIEELGITEFTDNHGKFAISDLPSGQYTLRIRAGGYSESTFVNLLVSVGVENILGKIKLYSLPSTGILQGRVTGTDGAPVEGARILIKGSSEYAAVTDVTGNYSVAGIMPERVFVIIAGDGHFPRTAQVDLEGGQAVILNPRLLRVPHSYSALPDTAIHGKLRGQVTDVESGQPISSVYVRVTNAESVSVGGAFTDVEGRFSIGDLSLGGIHIAVEKSGYEPVVVDATVYAGHTLNFNPALALEGNGQPTSNLDVTSEVDANTPLVAQLRGMVTDIETGTPLSGVEVDLLNSGVSVLSGADGSFLITAISPGEERVNVALPGYIDMVVPVSFFSGNLTELEIQLTPDSYIDGSNGGIEGRIVNAATNIYVPGAQIRLVGNGVDKLIIPDHGYFDITNLPVGKYSLTVFEDGTTSEYEPRNLNVLVEGGAVSNLGVIYLEERFEDVAIYGILTDEETGEPISNSVVTIANTPKSTKTSLSGYYRFEGIEEGIYTINFSATGYSTESLLVDLSRAGEYELNRELKLSESSGLDIEFFGTNQKSYDAYTPVEVSVGVVNRSSLVEAMVLFDLVNEKGIKVAEYNGYGDKGEANIQFLTDDVVEIRAEFNTKNLSPGNYRLIAKILVGDRFTGPATVTLAERAIDITINATALLEIRSIENLSYALFSGFPQEVNVLLTFHNRSNINISDFGFRYDVLNAIGDLIWRRPEIYFKSISKDDFTVSVSDTNVISFSSHGAYKLGVVSGYGGAPVEGVFDVSSEEFLVSPTVRIYPYQSITPTVIAPGGESRITVNIGLSGKEAQ